MDYVTISICSYFLLAPSISKGHSCMPLPTHWKISYCLDTIICLQSLSLLNWPFKFFFNNDINNECKTNNKHNYSIVMHQYWVVLSPMNTNMINCLCPPSKWRVTEAKSDKVTNPTSPTGVARVWSGYPVSWARTVPVRPPWKHFWWNLGYLKFGIFFPYGLVPAINS